VKRELIPVNPCDGIDHDDRPRRGPSRDHTPSIATIRLTWDALAAAPDHIRCLIRFLLLVPLRREEAWGLLWSEVDFDGKRIVIRAERMKTRQPHSLPLSEPALAVLSERAIRRSADDRLFAPPSGARLINWTYWVSRIRVVLGEDGLERSRRFNLHDVRRSFVSALAERDFDVDLLDQCLAHSRRGHVRGLSKIEPVAREGSGHGRMGSARRSVGCARQCGGSPCPMIHQARGGRVAALATRAAPSDR
jgi:integrase